MQSRKITLPFQLANHSQTNHCASLQVGDKLFLSGKLLTARDAAHQRMVAALERGEALPFALSDYPLYYCGPTPAKAGFPIGACGPTTSGRMDVFVPRLLMAGLSVMIGKGMRSEVVKEQIINHGGLYLIAIGGAGALYGQTVQACRCIAFEDLGPEAIYELEVKDFPCYVGIV